MPARVNAYEKGNKKMALPDGKVMTVLGPVEAEELGAVMMHEHLHSDLKNWAADEIIWEEKPATGARRKYLMDHAVPLLKQCREHGLGAFLDPTPPPWRAWPDIYTEVSKASGVHIILCTGYYREIETGTYMVATDADAIWPVVRESSVEQLAEICTREILEGIHGTGVHAGVIKLGTSQAPMTPDEIKTFRAGARAQKATGVHLTTHCTRLGAETSQLTILDSEGVDLSRVVIGHVAGHLMSAEYRGSIIEWMKRGVNFLPTNLGIGEDGGAHWQPLVDAIHEVFDAGHGDKLVLGLDSGYCSESCEFGPMTFLPPEPFLHMFSHVLPAFRKMGLTAQEEEAIMRSNPRRILPVRR